MLRPTRLLGLFPALLLACGPSVGPGGDSSEIVGGFPIGIEEAPWQISLQDPGFGHFCGGSILSADFVLTAQHCTEGGGEMQVLAGVDRLSDAGSGQVADVAEVIPFPDFTDPTQGKDVSLLRLAAPLELDGVRTAPIAIADASAVELGLTDPGVESTVSGWGALTEGGPSPDDLQAVEVPIISNEDAQASYPPRPSPTIRSAPACSRKAARTRARATAAARWSCPTPRAPASSWPAWSAGASAARVPTRPACTPACRRSPTSSTRTWAVAAAAATRRTRKTPRTRPGGEGALLINEVLADPGTADFNGDGVASTTEDEFVELVNAGAEPLDLSGATISDGFGVRGTLPDGTVLEPGQVLVVFGGGEPTGFEGVTTAVFTLGLNNEGDTITVTAADGTVLDEMVYGPEGNQDQSLTRSVDAEQSEFVLHSEVSSQAASPGTRTDGTAF